MMEQDRRSVPRLAVDALNHVGLLLRSEMAVARAEFAEKVSQAVTGAAFLVVAGLLLIPVAVVLLMALAAWFAELGLRAIAGARMRRPHLASSSSVFWHLPGNPRSVPQTSRRSMSLTR